MPSDIQLAIDALLAKESMYTMLYQYYDGDQPLVYVTERLHQVFESLNARFNENWCAVVVNSVYDRLEIRDFQIADQEQATKGLQLLREKSGLADEEGLIHEDVCVVGEAYMIVWPDEDGVPQVYRNDPRQVYVHYDEDNPRKASFAAKWWKTREGYLRLTMYYRDRLEYYVSERTIIPGEQASEKIFQPLQEAPVADNPYGVIPVFHFRLSRRRAKSYLDNVIEPQNIINKLLADLMVAAEFAAYRQRWIISQVGAEGLKNVPFGIWDIPASDGTGQATSVGEFAHTPLSNYLEALRAFAADIGIITETPRHFFFQQGGQLSGEALIAMESPLNRKVHKAIQALVPTWRDLVSFMLALVNIQITTDQIWTNYAPPETVQPKTQAEIRKLNVGSGIPLPTVLRDEGWDEADLLKMYDDEEKAAERATSYAEAAMEGARTRFDQGLPA